MFKFSMKDIFVIFTEASNFEFLRRNEKNAKHASRSELSPIKIENDSRRTEYGPKIAKHSDVLEVIGR